LELAHDAALDNVWNREEEVAFNDVLRAWVWDDLHVVVGRGTLIVLSTVLVGLVWLYGGGRGASIEALQKTSVSRIPNDATLSTIKSPRYNARSGYTLARRGPSTQPRSACRGVPLKVFTDLNVFPNEPSWSEHDEDEEEEEEEEDVREPGRSNSSDSTSTEDDNSRGNTGGSSTGDDNSRGNTSSNTSSSAIASPTHSLKRARSSDSVAGDSTTSSKRHHSTASTEAESLYASASILEERTSTTEHDGDAGRVEEGGEELDVDESDDEGGDDDAYEDDGDDGCEEDEDDDWSEDGSECDSPEEWNMDYAEDVIMLDAF